MNNNNSIVAFYPSHVATEAAIKELQQSGFDMEKLSVVGRDYQTAEQRVGSYNVGERMKACCETGAVWTGLWGVLFGSAFFWIPGLRLPLAAVLFLGWIIKTMENTVVIDGLHAIGAGLYRLGIPKSMVSRYETAFKTGKFALIAHCSMDETTHTKEMLNHTRPEAMMHHQ